MPAEMQSHPHVPRALYTGLWHTKDVQPSLVFSMRASLDAADASFNFYLQSQCTPNSSAEGRITAILMDRLFLCQTS